MKWTINARVINVTYRGTAKERKQVRGREREGERGRGKERVRNRKYTYATPCQLKLSEFTTNLPEPIGRIMPSSTYSSIRTDLSIFLDCQAT